MGAGELDPRLKQSWKKSPGSCAIVSILRELLLQRPLLKDRLCRQDEREGGPTDPGNTLHRHECHTPTSIKDRMAAADEDRSYPPGPTPIRKKRASR